MNQRKFLPAEWGIWTPWGESVVTYLDTPYSYSPLSTPQWKVVVKYKVDSPEANQMLEAVNKIFDDCKKASERFANSGEYLMPYKIHRFKDEQGVWYDDEEYLDFTFTQAIKGTKNQELVEFPAPEIYAPDRVAVPPFRINRGSIIRCCINLKGYEKPRVGIKAQLKSVQFKQLAEGGGGGPALPPDDITPEEVLAVRYGEAQDQSELFVDPAEEPPVASYDTL